MHLDIFRLLLFYVVSTSDGSVSVFEVGVGIFKVGLVFGIGISKYSDICIGIQYFSIFSIFPCLHYFKSVRSLCMCAWYRPPTVELVQCRSTL